MIGLHEFIIELQPLNETFKTESGLELYGHKDFAVDRLSNRIGKVISVPVFQETIIKEGDEVMIEPSVFHKQIYREKQQDYTNLVDKEKMWFRINPTMIVLYRKDKDDAWKGYLKNILVEPIEEQEEKITSTLIIIPEAKTKYKKDRVRLLYNNTELEEYGANQGDELVINPIGGVPFWIDGKEFWWIRNVDVYAVAI